MVSPPVTTGTLTANPAFNGTSNINLLTSTSSILDTGQIGTITFIVNVKINGPDAVTYYNLATGYGRGAVTDSLVSDISNAGDIVDPNHDGSGNEPGENVPTPINLEPVGIVVPDGFSPNGDGINDVFVIPGIEDYPDCELTVYNRWGNKIYYMKGYDNSWDGTPNDNSLLVGKQKAPSGTYYYVLKLNSKSLPDLYGFVVIKY
jgi:gliding motility-associated-like protein